MTTTTTTARWAEQAQAALAHLDAEVRTDTIGVLYVTVPCGHAESVDIEESGDGTGVYVATWLRWDPTGGISAEQEIGWSVDLSDLTGTVTRYVADNAADEPDGAPCCLDPDCGGNPCTFPGYADNH